MACETKKTWTCDRCGMRQVSTDLTMQPGDWVSIRTAQPPRRSDPDPIADLCGLCLAEFKQWLRSRRTVNP